MLGKKPRKGIHHMEIPISHEGRDYILVVQCTREKIQSAETRGVKGQGVKLNSAELFDMTSFRNK